MKFAGYDFLLIIVVFILLVDSKAMAQNVKKTSQDRVIYEQPMSYDDARKMQEIVQQLEKAKNEEGLAEQNNPLIKAMSESSGDNSKIQDILKFLIDSMGINALPDDLLSQKAASEQGKAGNSGNNNFKKWEDRHNWKGIQAE
ncbi:MAG: hypothetical protein KKD05_10930 [Candidatus Omnitrophica bacterium]|nr:hypothetical protein [Candidatus Omnitrophota bacterium]